MDRDQALAEERAEEEKKLRLVAEERAKRATEGAAKDRQRAEDEKKRADEEKGKRLVLEVELEKLRQKVEALQVGSA